MKTKLFTTEAPIPGGLYSQGVKIDKMVFLSGQLPIDAQTNQIELECPHTMYKQCFTNLKAVCLSAGGTLNDIVKLNVYYTNLDFAPILDEVMAEFFSEPYPARTRLLVHALSKGAKVEIDAIMYLQ